MRADDSRDDNDDNQGHTIAAARHRQPMVTAHWPCTAVGLVIVAVNFLAAAAILSWAAKKGPGAIYAAILGGFIGRLAVIVGVVFALESVSFIDIPVLVLTIAVTHIALLWWETRYVSLTLAAPGLKPGVGNPPQDEE